MSSKTNTKRPYKKRETNGTANSASVNGKTYAYKVESGVQITGVRSSDLFNKFPFDIMKVGDSFLIPAKDPLVKKPNALHYAGKQYARMKPGFSLTSRMQLTGERRVWRIK
jgi:hypothetical protein